MLHKGSNEQIIVAIINKDIMFYIFISEKKNHPIFSVDLEYHNNTVNTDRDFFTCQLKFA
jgi:hypothetical protein